MVKKRLENGEPCAKCTQTEKMLRRRGLWEQIEEVVWSTEGEPDSPGMLLAKRHGVEAAPFFVVQDARGVETVFASPLELIREHFPQTRAAGRAAPPKLEELPALAERLAQREPTQILRWALERYGADCAIAFSGAEDVVLVDMAARMELPYSVFSLDTGRLHPETHRFLDRVRHHYGIEIALYSPDATELEDFVRRKGLFSFYQDGHKECCGVRKVGPLKRALRNFEAWISGQRRDQSPATRSGVPVVLGDPVFEGASGSLIKLNPLANWTSPQVWAYIREHQVPYNELHERGCVSIGCEPCTRPTHPGQHEREGRWYWEEETQRECGLHVAGDGI
jgi:phosphoadenosine phosphosulfate reductase